ncbi:MAG: hypothetical protein KJP23_27155 [Deltaproteobacteria bacterium]|nr:hypothetical protein [Deltaproteobacteria bacterium]
MQKGSTIRFVILILLLVFLLIGVMNLFILRFQRGDIYPAYSSLRSDPLGTRGLYESLANFNEIAVQRNYHFLHSLKFEPETTLLYLGAKVVESGLIPERFSKVCDRLTQSGGRLVISYLPVNEKVEKQPSCGNSKTDNDQPVLPADNDARQREQLHEKKTENAREMDPGSKKNKAFKKNVTGNKLVSLKEKWGIGFAFDKNLPAKDRQHQAVEAGSRRPNLPTTISWHTNLYFNLYDDSWQTLYTMDGHPVIVERPMGNGTIVLCADSFFISNEALRSERYPALLVWLIGRHSNIIFEESHFGIYKHPGVATLLRHHRFHWFFIALAIVACLYVWKSAVYFVPPRKDDLPSGNDVVSGKDYTQGLVALLRRNIAGSKILQVCGQEWQQAFKKDKRINNDAVEHIKNILRMEIQSPKENPDPVTGYRKISECLQNKIAPKG